MNTIKMIKGVSVILKAYVLYQYDGEKNFPGLGTWDLVDVKIPASIWEDEWNILENEEDGALLLEERQEIDLWLAENDIKEYFVDAEIPDGGEINNVIFYGVDRWEGE